MKLPHILFALIAVLFISCSEEKIEDNSPLEDPLPDLHSPEIDSVYNSLSFSEKIKQLIWVDLATNNDSVQNLLKKFNPGGIYFKELSYSFSNALPDSGSIQPYLGTSLHQLVNLSRFNLSYNELNALQDSNLHHLILDSLDYYSSVLHLGYLNVSDSLLNINLKEKFIAYINQSKLSHLNESESRYVFGAQTPDKLSVFFDTILVDSLPADSLTKVLLNKNDVIFVNDLNQKSLESLNMWISGLQELNLVSEKDIEEKVRKVIAIKMEKGLIMDPVVEDTLKLQVKVPLSQQAYLIKENAIVLVKNDKQKLPLANWPSKGVRLIGIGQKLKGVHAIASKYADCRYSNATIKNLDLSASKNQPVIVYLNEQLDSTSGKLLLDKIYLYQTLHPIVLVNIENETNLKYLDSLSTLIHIPSNDPLSRSLAMQGVFGGVGFTAKLTDETNSDNLIGVVTKKTRLAYSFPEAVGFDPDSIKKIDKIAKEAVWGGVTPGCQVWAAKDGKVIYNKTFGFHTYDRNTVVKEQDVYDIASVTKVAATTLAGMKMYEMGKYKLQDSLKDHLPDSLTRVLKHKSRLSNVTFQELYTHKSGMPAGLPIYQFIAYVDSIIGKFDRYYCDESNSYYCVEVARDFYLDSAYLDSMWLAMNNIWPGEKKYKYSDANFNILYQVLRRKLSGKQTFNRFLDSVYYRPMMLRTTGYLPLENIDTLKHRIAPTEYDTYWRYQLLKGYVHDPNAALYGGVAGNAGLFTNANDLGVIFQMLLNGGVYGGKRYLKEETVRKFTAHQPGSHRGLGFDKPTGQSVSTVAPDCPTTSFGHTGFTGICAWADPENDLVFVFVSNRVHPDPNNKKIISYGIRKRIHQVFYDMMK